MSYCTPQNQDIGFTSAEALDKSANFFKALGHPVRLAIIEMLLHGERCVCELHANSGRDMSTISSHLKILKTAGVINGTQRGKNIYYAIKYPCIETVINCINTNIN